MGKGIEIVFKDCVSKGKIKISSDAETFAARELNIAKNDLDDANEGIKNLRWKWCTIQAYYSMFHSARALVFKKGYREKSHYCLRIALEYLYGESIPSHLVEDFQTAKVMRENADYEDSFSEIGARKIIKSAEEFYLFAEKKLK